MHKQEPPIDDAFHALYGYGDISGDGRNRFLIMLADDGVYVVVDLMSVYWNNGWIIPTRWREYPELKLAIATTAIRGV